MKKSYMIMDLQFGSTGKGLLCGYLAERYQPDVVVTAWGPNAGHTYIDARGRTYIHKMLANGIVSPNLQYVLIGPGSVVDLDTLRGEIAAASDIMDGKTLVIHPSAAIVTPEHREQEKAFARIGSTMKGTGAAVMQRIARDPENSNVARDVVDDEWIESLAQVGVKCFVSKEKYEYALDTADLIQIEGAQGYSLSIYHGFYPYTTSRDVTPAQVMADCAIPFSYSPHVYGTIRTLPIRVSNRAEGTSGPGYPDQKELDWTEDLGMEPELTTVTKLPRRIFTFSDEQLRDAIRQCAPDSIFLNFANYVCEEEVHRIAVRCRQYGSRVTLIGRGPTVQDVLIYHEEVHRP